MAINQRVQSCIDILFHPEDRERAKELLETIHEREQERCCLAALKISDGKLTALEGAAELARRDFRDLLMAADFGTLQAHLDWQPKPADELSEIDAVRLAEGIHARIAEALSSMGFERSGDEWKRNSEVAQSLRLITGLTSRVKTRFFLRLTFHAEPLGVMLQLPKLPRGSAMFSAEQGYVFESGGDEAKLYSAAAADVERYVKPWLERFTTSDEVRRGFEDGTFTPHIKLSDQPLALVF